MVANQVLSEVEYRVVGKRPVRPDGVDKVTGRAQYGSDLRLTGTLQAKILRSPHAHAKIKSIDTSLAEAYPGVRAVITGKDLPLSAKLANAAPGEISDSDRQRMGFQANNFLAGDKVLYKGHAVAAVAAVDSNSAETALALIKVEYEELPPVINVKDAMGEGSALLHENLHTSSLGETSEKPSNVASYMLFEKGDVEQGFSQSDIVIEREYETASVHQGYIEPHTATAHWNADGQLNICLLYTSDAADE